jgi:integrase
MPLRAIYRQALALDEVALNPTSGVQLPAVRGKRERIASPAEPERLITALPQRDRAIWATAMYAGLRSGELQALHRRARRPRPQPDPSPLELGPEGRPGSAQEQIRASHRARARALRKHLLEHRLARGRRGVCSSAGPTVVRSRTSH